MKNFRYILLLSVVISLFSGCVTRRKVIGYIANHSDIKDSILAANPCVFKVDSSIAAKIDTIGLIQFLQGQGVIPCGDSLVFVPNIFPKSDTAYLLDADKNSENGKGIHTNMFTTNPTVLKHRTIDTAAIIAGLSKYYVPRIDFEQDERTLNPFKNLIADKCEVIAGLNANLSDAGATIDKQNKTISKDRLYITGLIILSVLLFLALVYLLIKSLLPKFNL